MSDMILVMTLGIVALAVLSLAGVSAAWYLSRLMDRKNASGEVPFRAVLDTIEQAPKAAALYYGLRWVGICLLIGMLFSRAV